MPEILPLTRRTWLLRVVMAALIGLHGHACASAQRPKPIMNGPKPIMNGPCGGKRVPIDVVIERRECERCKTRGPLREIESRLQLSAARVAPAGTVQARVVLRNRGRSPVVLPFIWHAGPLTVLTTLDARGSAIPVEGSPPPVGPGGYRPGPPYPICLNLVPGGEAYVERTWKAVRWRWAAVPRLPSGEPVSEPAGPLPAGRYQLRLQTTLQDAALGAPTAWIEVR